MVVGDRLAKKSVTMRRVRAVVDAVRGTLNPGFGALSVG